MLNSARTNYLVGRIESECGHTQQAEASYRRAVQATGSDQLIWARAAAKKLEGFNEAKWTGIMQAALARSEARATEGTPTSWSLYLSGVLESELGNKQRADADFQEALLLPDRLLAYHFIRLARAGSLSH